MSQTPPAETQIQINILNDITQTMIDSYNGYKTCLQDFQNDNALYVRFTERANSRSQIISEFQSAVEELGGEPKTEGSISGAAHRGLIKFTTLFQDDAKAACQAIDDGEAFLAEKIKEALRTPELLPRTETLLNKALKGAQQGELFANVLESSL
ncbi:PA2169 family four-helix-bundle protein [Litorimonas sp.]|jgi:uncharacterized protein (TIGR02284 family)|uniref:PA2169 family four-helix-bundle protein n=1 Tax=Litorimonas sp. TaxID=1892381 RepID=UPI003A8BAD4C